MKQTKQNKKKQTNKQNTNIPTNNINCLVLVCGLMGQSYYSQKYLISNGYCFDWLHAMDCYPHCLCRVDLVHM